MGNLLHWLSRPQLYVIVVVLGGLAILLMRWTTSTGPNLVNVSVPRDLSGLAQQGKVLFEANCAECHGKVAEGTDHGPPFVHDIYNPGHHADLSFVLAVRNGVRAHHWPFGNMPPQPQVTEAEVGAIVQYVRELQQANGIGYRPHTM